ncbi:MLP family protein [Clostridium perfringens]|nr:MLP family protein [Clostridium perfringens]
MVKQVEILSDGIVFYEIFMYRLYLISEMSPVNIQGVDLLEGNWGTVGSVIFFKYTIDGKEKTAKDIVEAIDEETKSVTFKIVEGDLMELYKTFIIIVQVDTKGEHNSVTWTFHYEKLKEDVEEPNTLMDFCIEITKDIETYHLK